MSPCEIKGGVGERCAAILVGMELCGDGAGYLVGRNSDTGQQGERLRALRPGPVLTDIVQ